MSDIKDANQKIGEIMNITVVFPKFIDEKERNVICELHRKLFKICKGYTFAQSSLAIGLLIHHSCNIVGNGADSRGIIKLIEAFINIQDNNEGNRNIL